jgi:DNA-binding protein HU-beta
LFEESDDLFIGKSCGLHIRNSPKFADLLPLPWYGWQGAGHTITFPKNIGNQTVNKTELVEHIAHQSDISKAAATRALESIIDAVKKTLKKGNSVTLVGFGTFSVGKRAARTGRNPRTGAAIKIKAAKVPKFKPGKTLKDHLN